MGVLQFLLNELDQAAPKTDVEDRRPQSTWPPGFAPCKCGSTAYWQDGHGRVHCDRCEPREKKPETKNVVAEKTKTASPPPGRNTRHRCRLCYQEPDKWMEVKRGPNSDRVRVECRVCGKFIGYKFVS